MTNQYWHPLISNAELLSVAWLDWCIRWHVRIDVMMFTLDASLGSEADALRTTRIIRSLWLGPSAAGCNQKV
jgi:hypothetical protein